MELLHTVWYCCVVQLWCDTTWSCRQLGLRHVVPSALIPRIVMGGNRAGYLAGVHLCLCAPVVTTLCSHTVVVASDV